MPLECPLCNTKEYSLVYDKLEETNSISIVKCSHCEHIYTLSLSGNSKDDLYTEGTYKLVENRNSIFDKILSFEYKRVVNRINRYLKGGSLLDFGCGKGKFASLAQQKGWNVNGVETAPERAAYAKEVYGLNVSTSFYATGSIFEKKFDVLTLFHVLEHLPQPEVLLTNLLRDNLAKNRLVIIEVPNFKSLQARIAGNKWMHLDATRHISHFTPTKLEELARKLKLKTKRTTFFSFHLGVLGMTDSILRRLGYKNNIISELKTGKKAGLRIAIILLLPFTLLLEFFASVTGRGGVIRKYFIFSD